LNRAKEDFKEARATLPVTPWKMYKNSDKVISQAEKLKNNNQEDAAIKLLESATKQVQRTAKVLKKQEENINKVIELLNNIKAGLS